jgi:hypothetical protein
VKQVGGIGPHLKVGVRQTGATSMLAAGNPLKVAAHLGDTLETLNRTYAHWLSDDNAPPTAVLDRLLMPGADEARTGTE